MNNWKQFIFKQNYKELNNTMEVKLNNGKVISIWNVVGGSLLDSKGEEIMKEYSKEEVHNLLMEGKQDE